MQYIADIKRKEGMKMAEQTETDKFVAMSYERENELNAEIDYLHKFRYEIINMQADSKALKRIKEILIDHEEWKAIELIKEVIKNTGEN